MYTEPDKTSEARELAKAPKSETVINRLRQQIIAGLKPDTKLASFNEMEQALGVSRTVLREAVNQLKQDGFIYSVDRRGLFVSPNPPHLSRFALVFPNNPSSPVWPRFSTALQQEAAAYQQQRSEIGFTSYYDVGQGPHSDSYERLYNDLQAQRLAGVLLLPPGHGMWQTEPLKSAAVPKVYIWGSTEVGRVPSIGADEGQLRERMANWLLQRGRKRIAAVSMRGNNENIESWLSEKGLLPKSHWFQTLGRDNVPQVRKIVSLLMDYPAGERPDGLMVLDDNLTEHAVGGLLDLGLKIGHDIDVIAHCNWPWPVASPAPIQRVGYHARHVLSLAIRAIELMRQNRQLATELARVPALFESEVDKPWRADAFDISQE